MMGDNDFATGYAIGQSDNGNRGNGMFGGDCWIWIIVVFALLFGWGNGGWGGNGGAAGATPFATSALTQADLQRGFDTQSIVSKLDGLTNGLCDSTYALNNGMQTGFANVQQSLCQGFNSVNTAMLQGFNGVERGQADLGYRLQDCCCQTQRAIDGVNYNMATNTCAIQNTIQNTTRDVLDSNNANTRAILDFLTQDKISALQAENQTLKLAASQSAQNSYLAAMSEAQTAELIRRLGPSPIPAYQVPAPYPYALNNGCMGCGNT